MQRTWTAIVIALILTLTACTSMATEPRGSAHLIPRDRAAATLPIRFAAVGDSLTAGSPCAPLLTAETGISPCSWVMQADRRERLKYVGGWAMGGSTSAQQRANVTPVPDAQVLVVMSGTNDLTWDLPVSAELVNLDAIVATVGAPHVLLMAVPPHAGLLRSQSVSAWNAALQAHAVAKGWMWFDPWAPDRAGEGWVAGVSKPDGIHPKLVYEIEAGQRIADFLTTHSAGF